MTGFVVKEFVASNGIIEGCPLGVLWLNVLRNTTAMPKVYVDDAGVLSGNSP